MIKTRKKSDPHPGLVSGQNWSMLTLIDSVEQIFKIFAH